MSTGPIPGLLLLDQATLAYFHTARLMPLMERSNRMFLRNLRVLRKLKIHPASINIAQAGQVNVGHQQVNVKGP